MNALKGAQVHAVVVGIESFALGAEYCLDGAAAEALRFAEWARTAFDVPPENISLFLGPLQKNENEVKQACAALGLTATDATRAAIRKCFVEELPRKEGQLLLAYWSGHGVIAQRERRQLLYSDASKSDLQSFDLTDAMTRLRSADMSGLPFQVFFIDCCATYFDNIPRDQIPVGSAAATGVRQFAIFSAAPGQVARQKNRKSAFAEKLLPLLESAFPPRQEADVANIDRILARVAEDLSRAFQELAASGQIAQTPVDYEWSSWSGRGGALGASHVLQRLDALGFRQGAGGRLSALQRPRQAHLIARHHLFGGRDSDIRVLDKLIEYEDRPYCLVHGESGMGKSALLANWILDLEGRGVPVVYHFISRVDDMADEETALLNLCQQLVSRHGLDGHLPSGRAQLRALYHQLIRLAPLDSRALILVIDGLDEADLWKPNFELIPDTLPSGVRVVFSARDRANVDVISDLHLPPSRVERLSLYQLDSTRVAELLRKVGMTTLADDDQIVAAITLVSGGDPFYLKYLLEDLNLLPQISVSAVNARPMGLNEFLSGWYNQLCETLSGELRDQIDGVLCLLLASEGRLTAEDISDVTKIPDPWLRKTLGLLSRFIVGEAGTGYAICHARFAEFLAPKYGTAVATARQRLVDWCLERKESRGADVPVYALKHLAKHLYALNETDRLFELFDRNWLQQHFAQVWGYRNLIADLDLTIAALWRETPRKPSGLARMQAVRQLSRWHVSNFSELDLATLALLGEEERAVELALGRDDGAQRLTALLTVVSRCERNRQSLLDEIAAIADRDSSIDLKSRAYAGIGFALAKMRRFDEACDILEKVQAPQYRLPAAQLIAAEAATVGDEARARRLLEDMDECIRSRPEPGIVDLILESIDLRERLSLSVRDALQLAILCEEASSSTLYRRVVRRAEIARHLSRLENKDVARDSLTPIVRAVLSDASSDLTRMQIRLGSICAELGQASQARRWLAAADESLQNASGYDLKARLEGAAHECIVLKDFVRAEQLIARISDGYARSRAIHDLMIQTWECGDIESAVQCIGRISDPTFMVKAASNLAFRFAEKGQYSRSREFLFRAMKSQTYQVHNVSSDATANWMRSAVLGLASLLATAGDTHRCRVVINFANHVNASPQSGNIDVWYYIAQRLIRHREIECALDVLNRAKYGEWPRRAAEEVTIARALLDGDFLDHASHVITDIMENDEFSLFDRLSALRVFSNDLRSRSMETEARAFEESWSFLRERFEGVIGGRGWRFDYLWLSAARGGLNGCLDSIRMLSIDAQDQNALDDVFSILAWSDQPDVALQVLDANPDIPQHMVFRYLEDIGESYRELHNAAGVDAVARRILAIQFPVSGAKVATKAAELWMREGRRDACTELLRVLNQVLAQPNEASDPDIRTAVACCLAYAGAADEAVKAAIALPQASADFGILGPDYKFSVITALVKAGSLDHAAQLLGSAVVAPDGPDVWLSRLADSLSAGPPQDAETAIAMFVEAASVIGWVREDWRDLVDLVGSRALNEQRMF
jgi:tetratricopeptide (TPR) repeat protein